VRAPRLRFCALSMVQHSAAFAVTLKTRTGGICTRAYSLYCSTHIDMLAGLVWSLMIVDT
jgi:hypothetical protein